MPIMPAPGKTVIGLVAGRTVDRHPVHRAVTASRGAGKVNVDSGADNVGAGEVVDDDIVRTAQDLQANQFDAVEVRGDAVDIAGEAHASTIGGDIDVLGEVDAVEVEPVDAVLTFDGVVGIALIPLKDVVAGAQESDVVARAPIDHIVAAAAIERVSARQSEQDVCATVAGQNVALAASKHLFDAAQRVARRRRRCQDRLSDRRRREARTRGS